MRHACLVCCQPRGKLSLFALDGRSWDEANPSKRGKVACKACKARVVSVAGIVKGTWSHLREQVAADNRGGQGVHGPGPEAKRAADGDFKFASSNLHERAVVPNAACRGCVGRARSPKRATVALVESFKFAPRGWCQGGDFTPYRLGQVWAVLNGKDWFCGPQG